MVTNWKNKKVAVLGLGIEGLASVRYLHEKGAEVTVLDEEEKDKIDREALRAISELGVRLITGKKSLDNLGQFDVLVRSPGFKLLRSELKEAVQEGVKITSQTQLFLEVCPCRVVGVTGTKGKGTTSTLIYEMLKKSGLAAYLGGNIGRPPFDFLNKLTPQSIVVLELSSFQLQDLTISPHIAVILMIVPEHLNYHTDMAEYVEAKRNIFRFQTRKDFAVLNRDYPMSNESDVHTDAKIFSVSRERSGLDQGCFLKDGAIWMAMHGTEWKVIDIAKIKLPGKHNLENVCAAVMASTLVGSAKEDIVAVLSQFTGLEHRLELVREVGGVKYYDDSIATNPESAIAGIEAFEAPKILILGGVTEGSSFEILGKMIAKNSSIKAVIGIGKEWPNIKSEIIKHKSPILLIEGAGDMHAVVQAAAKIAKANDIVLLSPACKSFDMFKNYKERGEQFKEAVRSLKV